MIKNELITSKICDKIYIIQHKDKSLVIALKIKNDYVFNNCSKDNACWRSIDCKFIKPLMNKITCSETNTITMSHKNALKLLIIQYHLFKDLNIDNFNDCVVSDLINPNYNALDLINPNYNVSDLINPNYNVSDLINPNYNEFACISKNEIRETLLGCVGSILHWRMLYINAILKTYGLHLMIEDWNVLKIPIHYVIKDERINESIRLNQLKKSLDLVLNNETNIPDLNSALIHVNELIKNVNIVLPNVCIHFKYPQHIKRPMKDILEQILHKAHLGISGSLLYTNHGIAFDFKYVQSIMQNMFCKDDIISSNEMIVFNCYTMYEVIHSLINTSEESVSKTNEYTNILKECYNIMKMVYGDYKYIELTNPHSAIDYIYTKSFGDYTPLSHMKITRTNDKHKYELLADFILLN